MERFNLYMKIAILGATSQIAKDLIKQFYINSNHDLHLFARNTGAVITWLESFGDSSDYPIDDLSSFGTQAYDVVINFIGVGNPSQAQLIGASIFELTMYYDNIVLDYLKKNRKCQYIFLSSGAAYGSSFTKPVTINSQAQISINDLSAEDWYGVAKLHAECRHRASPELAIIDIRIFNYFSHTQDMSARFLITDMVRAIQKKSVLLTSSIDIMRDYIGSEDFYHLINNILSTNPTNDVLDCYSKAPISKITLLESLEKHFGMQYKFNDDKTINATGLKNNYYSLNRHSELYGYFPTYTSQELLLQEIEIVTHKKNNH